MKEEYVKIALLEKWQSCFLQKYPYSYLVYGFYPKGGGK